MNKLINYIKKIGLSQDSYRVEQFGKNYFYNTSICFNGVCVVFDYSTYGAMKVEQQQKMLRKYCNRYGYKVFNEGGAPGLWWFSILKYSDFEALKDYNSFADSCNDECLKLAHSYHAAGIYDTNKADLNAAMKKLMIQYEGYYLDYLKHIEPEAV